MNPYTRTPPEDVAYYLPQTLGLVPYAPKAGNRKLLARIHSILNQYASLLPLTVRQVYYRLVATHAEYPKTQDFYKNRVVEVIARARRGGLLAWDAIRDDGIRSTTVGWGYDDLQDFYDSVLREARSFDLDRSIGQPKQVIAWCEAAGMVPQMERACRGLPVKVISTGGTDSVTAKYELAQACLYRDTVVLHVGDLDAMGLVGYHQLRFDVAKFIDDICAQKGWAPPSYRCVRVAVQERHVNLYGLLTGVAKAGDAEKLWYPGINGDVTKTCEVEALPPDILARMVRDAAKAEVDLSRVVDVVQQNRRDRKVASRVLNTALAA